MRIPVLIASIGPCESSWVPRRGLGRLRVDGLNGDGLVVVSDCGREWYVGSNGTFRFPWESKRVRVKHISEVAINVDLVA